MIRALSSLLQPCRWLCLSASRCWRVSRSPTTRQPVLGRPSPAHPSWAGSDSRDRIVGRTRVQYQLSRLVAGPFLRGLWRPEVTGAEYVPETGGGHPAPHPPSPPGPGLPSFLLQRPEVTGAEYVPETGGAILASNHLSILDSVFLPFMLKRPVTFTAKSEYFTSRHPAMRLMGRYLRSTGQIPVDREGARAAQATLEAAPALLRQGQLFGIYPEGTRSPDGRLYRARPGVGWLAMNSGLPVIPVAMMGTDKVLPPGQSVPRLGKVWIKIGKPMTFGAEADGQA